MAKAIKVEVGQDDIDKAFRSDSARCVVAQAIARTLPDASRISVDVQTVRFTDGRGVRRVYLTPVGVEQYVIAFDAGETIQPFGFGLYDTQRVNVPRSRPTAPGKKRDAARYRVQYAERKVAKLAADPDASDAARTLAAEKLAERRTELATLKAEHDGGPLHKTEHPTADPDVIAAKRAPRTVRSKGAKSNERNYGHRTLRINQQRPTAEHEG